jgi:outer membrane protein assembly factor BamE (lipoprotein component of BamABCDE complex)
MATIAQAAAAGMPRHVRLVILGLCLALMAACATVYRNHGYAPTDLELSALEVGVDTRETTAEKVGLPSTSGLLNDDQWFFVQSRFQERPARPPLEIDRQVVVISFNEGGTVSNVERFGLEDGQVVALSRRVTETNIKGVSFIRQLMGNFGRLTTDQLVN